MEPEEGASAVPDHHDGEDDSAEENGDIAAIHKLAEVGGEEGDIEGEEEGEDGDGPTGGPSPGAADDEEEEDGGEQHGAGDGDAIGGGETGDSRKNRTSSTEPRPRKKLMMGI